MTSVNPRGYLASTSTSASTPSPGPSAGWLIGCSLWLVPVLLGSGGFTWLGFAIIGLVLLRRSWLIAAVVYAVLAFMVSVLSFSAIGTMLQIPVIVVGTIHALVANRTWLVTLWGRRERGERMLGRGGAAAAPRHAVPAVPLAPAVTELALPEPTLPEPTQLEPTRPEPVLPEMASGSPAPAAPARTVLPTFTATPVSDPLRSTAPTSTPSSPVTPLRVDPISTVLSSSALAASGITSLPMTVLGASSVILPPREALNPMTAPPELLAAIPVIGPEGAARIVAAREHHVLDSVQAVADAVGLQGFELVRIRPFLRFD